MLAHNNSAASGDGDVSGVEAKPRDDFVIGSRLGRSVARERDQQYQCIKASLHGGLRNCGRLRLTFTHQLIEFGWINGVFSCPY